MVRIIGEKINGTRKRVGEAIVARDVAAIEDLARRQADAGADWLDVNAGTAPDREPDDLVWLVSTVQAATDVPLCLDSANPAALSAALEVVAQPPLINSISGETRRLTGVLPLAAEHGTGVIALALDDDGIPAGHDDRLGVLRDLVTATRDAGIPDDRLYLDPLVLTVATDTRSAVVTLDVIRALREEVPEAHVVSGLSNVSFGLPARRIVNRTYLTLAVAAGLDTAILDPLDRDLRAAVLATELLLGHDRHCLGFTRAYRAGLLTPEEPARAGT